MEKESIQLNKITDITAYISMCVHQMHMNKFNWAMNLNMNRIRLLPDSPSIL